MVNDISEWGLQQDRQRHELFVQQREIEKESAVEYAKMVHAREMQARQFSKDYGQMAVRSLFLLNGGAMVSLIAFMGSIADGTAAGKVAFQPSDFMPGFSAFVTGLFLAMITMILGYANFEIHTTVSAGDGDLADAIRGVKQPWPHDVTEEKVTGIRNTANWAVGVGLASMISFLVGCILIGSAFAK